MLEEAVVETRVVRHENATADSFGELIGDLSECRGARHHRIADPSKRLDFGRNAALGIDQRVPFAHALAVVDAYYANLGDAILRSRGAGGFQVDEGN